MAHISTISVGGYCSIEEPLTLTELELNIGQSFKNHTYMITKYLAEYDVLKAINDKEIKGSVFRLGNIMPRLSDNVFQHNIKDNAMISRLQTLKQIHALTEETKDLRIDFSPVDLCAESILKLMQMGHEQTIYHIVNNNTISIQEFFDMLQIDYTIVSKEKFVELIKSLNDPLSVHLLNDLHKDNFIETPVNSALTIKVLEYDSFKWNVLNKDYLKNINKLFNN